MHKSQGHIRKLLQNLFHSDSAGNWPSPGLYHFIHSVDGYDHHAHLRIEKNGNAVLFVDANSIIYLNATAAFIAYWHLNHKSKDEILKGLDSIFVDQQEMESDYQQTVQRINALIHPEDQCPVCDLDLDLALPFSNDPIAPYRMDLAITYRCNNQCAHCYNARSRTFPELPTDQWKLILDRIWNIGIPHVVFTGGEPTLRKDLPELIAYAQSIGLITGLNTNGRKFQNTDFVSQLVDAGLDHVQITFESHDAAIHDEMVCSQGAWQETIAGIRNAVESSLFLMTNTTMLNNNSGTLQETLHMLGELNVPTVGLNALIYSGSGLDVQSGIPEEKLPELLDIAKEITEQQNQRLIWYTPTQYCHFNPIHFELGIKGCSAARYNMCVEPNGDVLPCQSYYQSLGNLLQIPWEQIWNHPLALQIRHRTNLPEVCHACDFVAECGGGCPLARDAGKVTPPVAIHSI
ncbi:MAG: radical SAM protein [Anaerolineaceae bacterium]|nr:radical SAM protein [Anaerolineaceae bacterium]